MIRLILAACLILPGLFVIGVAVTGIFRFSTFLNRVHAASTCDTLGAMLILSGLMVLSGFTALSLKLLLVLVFMWLGNPVASHLLAKTEVQTHPDLTRVCDSMDLEELQ